MIPNSKINRILVTGGMGFIGSSFLLKCCKKFPNIEFINADNLSYSFSPKTQEELNLHKNHSFLKTDICDIDALENIFRNYQINMIVVRSARMFFIW